MATCKECVSYELCEYLTQREALYLGRTEEIYKTIKNHITCKFFKNKSDFQEVKHGEWNDNIIGFCNVCTECGAIVDRYSTIKNNSGKLNYCPNCGAKMDGGKSE